MGRKTESKSQACVEREQLVRSVRSFFDLSQSLVEAPSGLPRYCILFMHSLVLSLLLLCASSPLSAQSDSLKPPSLTLSNAADPGLEDDRQLIQSGRYARAEAQLRAYEASHQDSADARFLLGYVLYRENKPQDSLAAYTDGARLRKPSASDLATVAMDYILLRDYGDAETWLTRATSWEPDNAQYWYLLGRTKYNVNRFQEAVDAFKKVLTLRPNDVRAEYNLGLSYAGLGKSDDAIASYKTAIEWQEQAVKPDPQPYLDLGALYLEQSHPDQALPYLQKAATFGPSNPRIHEELGLAYEQLHRLAEAQASAEKAIALAPNIPSLHFELGRIERKEGLHDKAKEEFDRCAALNATHSTESTETPNPEQQ